MASCPSNREEIIELAQLEVLGALEGADGARLERLFQEASPAIQREVVDLQASLSVQSLLLPVIEPERSLRLRVLASVAQAVESADAELAPIASIGRPQVSSHSSALSTTHSLARSGDESDSQSASVSTAAVPSIQEVRWRRAARLWRAACITAVASVAAVTVFQIATARQAARIGELALQNTISDELSDLLGKGRKSLKAVLDEGCIVKGLVGATVRDNGSATVALTPTFDEARVVWIDLALGQTVTLQSVDRQSGAIQTVGNFVVEHRIGGTELHLRPGIANANSDWRIIDARGSLLFSSRPAN